MTNDEETKGCLGLAAIFGIGLLSILLSFYLWSLIPVIVFVAVLTLFFGICVYFW